MTTTSTLNSPGALAPAGGSCNPAPMEGGHAPGGAPTALGWTPGLPTGTPASLGLVGLPGVAVGSRPPGPLPRVLLAPGSLLLIGAVPGQPTSLSEHRSTWGPQPGLALPDLIRVAELAGIVGAGGAQFPFARKLASLGTMPVWAVVVNGSEGESASGKDGVLLTHVPHLVLDGAVAAGHALGGARVVVRVSQDRPDLAAALAQAVAERPDGGRIEVSIGPARFAAGEASAVIRALRGGPALPGDLGRPPQVRVGLRRRREAVLLSNVETFARLAVATREIRSQSALLSLSGAVPRPGVLEVERAETLGGVLALAGGPVGHPRLLVTGGWHGRWLAWDARAAGTALDPRSLGDAGGRWGAGAFIWVPEEITGLQALAAVAGTLAAGSAGQCGPCARGLPELAVLLARTAAGTRLPDRAAVEAAARDIEGRGLCAHPSAAIAAVRSALDLLGARP